MLTVASIMAIQKSTTEIRFYFGVTQHFSAEIMIKVCKLKNKINNLTESDFCYLKDSVEKMKKLSSERWSIPI